MTTIYTKSITTDFGGIFIPRQASQLSVEINATNPAFSATLLSINIDPENNDTDRVDIVFDGALLNPSETDVLNTIISNHVQKPPDDIPNFYIKPGEDVVRFDKNNNTYNLYGKYSKTVIISKEGQGDYTTIKDALDAHPEEYTIYQIHPGVYVENNPLVIPSNSLMESIGTTAQTTIVAANPGSNIFVLGAWCQLRSMIITGATTLGSIAVYFDGSQLSIGAFSLISECIITNCDVGIVSVNGPDILLGHRVLITPSSTGSTLSKGVYVHSGGHFISSSISIVGIPSPPYPGAVPITDAIICTGLGSKISMTTTNVLYCTHATVVDDDGEIELQLITSTQNNIALCIGSTGTNSKFRATLYEMKNSITYDIDIQSSDADIALFSTTSNNDKINNPNNVRYSNNYHSLVNGVTSQTMTGDLRLGDKNAETTVSIGQGKYDISALAVLSNDNLEAGTWTTLTTSANDDNAFALFAGIGVGNCLYIGGDDPLTGVKFNISTSTTSVTPKSSIIWEYWNGALWIEFKVMTTEALPPFRYQPNSVVSIAGTQQVRFGLRSDTPFTDKTLNGITKKWIRLRVAIELPSIPEAIYTNLHMNGSKFGSDGFMDQFGDSRTVKTLPWSINNNEPSNTSPGNQDVYISDKLCVGLKENLFSSSAIDRIGSSIFLPNDFDNSFPVKLKFAIIGDTGVSGDVEFTARWNISNNSSSVYRTAVDAPTSSTGELSNSTIISIASVDSEYRGEIELDLNDINPVPTSGTPPLLWISLERDATVGNSNDTYTGNIAIIQLTVLYISWRHGGHILSF